MLNYAIMSRWQNWVIVFLMFTIAAVGFHAMLPNVEKE